MEELLNELEEIKSSITEGELSLKDRYAYERIFQLLVEECINLGSHIISGLALKRADTYREVFTILKDNSLITPQTSEKMDEFVKLRNRIVHNYWRVEEEELRKKIKESHWFKRFAEEVFKALKERELI